LRWLFAAILTDLPHRNHEKLAQTTTKSFAGGDPFALHGVVTWFVPERDEAPLA